MGVHRHSSSQRSSDRANAYSQLKQLALKFQSRDVAKIAVELKTGGHFDKVIIMIDEMIGLLRKEEQEDIEHRDRCENSQNANKNEFEDEIEQLKKDIKASEKDMAELLKMRNKDV